jgi:type II secretory pathway component PulC
LPNPGKRDKFLSPIAAAAMRGPAAGCSTGKHCLVVDQIALKGIVQTNEGNIAMVENAAKRSYYLHENDALFDGSVVKITGDSVTFRQESTDILGRPVSKEVVKKVSAPAV